MITTYSIVKADKGFIVYEGNKTLAFSTVEEVLKFVPNELLNETHGIMPPNVESVTIRISVDRVMKDKKSVFTTEEREEIVYPKMEFGIDFIESVQNAEK